MLGLHEILIYRNCPGIRELAHTATLFAGRLGTTGADVGGAEACAGRRQCGGLVAHVADSSRQWMFIDRDLCSGKTSWVVCHELGCVI